jgi:ABC-type glycerol-3-phosphate transport system permease component
MTNEVEEPIISDKTKSTANAYLEGDQLNVKSMLNLYFKPTKFFSSQIALGKTKYLLFIVWIVGISGSIDRIDEKLLQAEVGNRASLDSMLSRIVDSWLSFWPFVLLVGAVGGYLLYLGAGWWYNVRLYWSGAKNHDKFSGRVVYLYSSFIVAFPSIVYVLISMFVYSSYREAFNSDKIFSSLLLIFSFWSVIVSYKAVKTTFNVVNSKARIWFLILPILIYVLFLGIFAIIMALMNERGHR